MNGEASVMALGFAQTSFKLNHDAFIMAVFTCFILCIGLFNTAFAASTIQHPKDVCQTIIQSIMAAQGNVNQEMQRPVQGWVNLEKLPDRWEKRWPEFHGIAWYKIHFSYTCDTNMSNPPLSFAIEGITQSGKIFLNDDLLWQDLYLKEPASRSQYMPRIWNLPTSSLKQGQNTLWIQVYGSITQKSGLGHVALGNYPSTYSLYKKWLLEKRTLPEFNTMVNIVVGVFYLLAWLANRKEKAFLWFAVTGLGWVIYSFCFLYTDPIYFLSFINIDRLQNIIFCIYTVTGCLGAWYFANKSFPRIQKLLFIFLAVATVCITLAPTNQVSTVIQFFFSVAVVIFLLKCITYPFIAYKSNSPETYLLAVLYLIYLPIAFNDAHFMFTMEGRPLSPYTGPFTTMALGAILAMRLARNARQIERFNKTLAENVTQAKQELTASLGQQHKLSIENARLQERIHLSHDLHDGLGGSIVRSIITMEQNDKITKPQVLSILKMLRSDLRQIVDSGSSFSCKVPSNPMEWGAPIRYRFIQLFEEIDIRSHWNFEKTWKNIPISLQCLTLTRVLEEALTNIVKHSQASEVNISLTETENNKLMMCILDNGIGFNPKTVEAGLHVGLQSMQARIHRLGGEFKIDSQPGKTSIQVLLPLTINKINRDVF
ncbi:ATP-binding protein [Acinetobacter sp. 228]